MADRGTLPEVSNLASLEEQIEFLDSETSEPMNLANVVDIIVTISDQTPQHGRGLYGYDGGRIQASLQGGEITLAPDFLSCTLRLERSRMQALAPKTYELGARLIFVIDTNEQQVFLGFLPVVEGL